MAAPSESDGLRIEKLDKDYATWAILFQASLEDKELWTAIEDPQPDEMTDPIGAATWMKKNRREFGRLKLSVEPHHLQTIQNCITARAAWDALEALFTAQTNSRRLQLGKELAALAIRAGETLLAYQGRVKKLQAEMVGAGHPIDDNTAILHFMTGLGEAYWMEQKILTSRQTELGWETVMPMLFPVESAMLEKAAVQEHKEGPAAAAYAALLAALPHVAGAAGAAGTSTAAPRLSRAECRKRVTCWTCNQRGHYQSECPQNPNRPSGSGSGPSAAFMAAVKTVTLNPAPDVIHYEASTSHRGAGVVKPTASVSAVGVHPGVLAPAEWLIDSGASHNMRTMRLGIRDYVSAPTDVTIADGNTFHSPGRGSVTLTISLGGFITLGNTLFVPGITSNLLSARAMAKTGKVTFEGDEVTVEQNGMVVATGRVNSNDQYTLDGGRTVDLSGPSSGAGSATAAIAYGKGQTALRQL